MLNQTTIYNTQYQAKWYMNVLLTNLNAKRANGEDITECQNQYILLGMWIDIMDRYLTANYDTAGNITPETECLTLDQMLELVAKVKVMLGNFKYVSDSDWILATGIWADSGFWRDSASWIDSPIV